MDIVDVSLCSLSCGRVVVPHLSLAVNHAAWTFTHCIRILERLSIYLIMSELIKEINGRYWRANDGSTE